MGTTGFQQQGTECEVPPATTEKGIAMAPEGNAPAAKEDDASKPQGGQQLNGKCSKDTECSQLYTRCSSHGVCVCALGFEDVDNTCVAATELNNRCTLSVQCITEHAICLGQKCKCNNGYMAKGA